MAKALIFLAYFYSIITSARLESGCSCEANWVKFNSYCYNFTIFTTSWVEANDYCTSQGAAILDIKSDGENTFIAENIPPLSSFWLKFKQLHGSIPSGTTPTESQEYQKYVPNTSAGDCSAIVFNSYWYWSTCDGSENHMTACKKLCTSGKLQPNGQSPKLIHVTCYELGGSGRVAPIGGL